MTPTPSLDEVVVGLDPGGRGAFGWCVAANGPALPLRVLATGVGSYFPEVRNQLRDAIGGCAVAGFGIDAPLYWCQIQQRKHARDVDKRVRAALESLRSGAGASVQAVNTLQGACIALGLMVARELLDPEVQAFLSASTRTAPRITEAHPTALFRLLDASAAQLPGKELRDRRLPPHLAGPPATDRDKGQHQRDATLAAITAWAMVNAAPGWRNIRPPVEPHVVDFLPTRAEYWMPFSSGNDGDGLADGAMGAASP